MAFSVKATLVNFIGDPERYPCHMNLEIGDVLTFDGAELKGRVCPDALPALSETMIKVFTMGPRYKDPAYYNLFWYSVNSCKDPELAKYDGNGYKPIQKEFDEPKHHLRDLIPPGGFHWPPATERTVCKDVMVMCPDARTGGVFKIEAYDFALAGHMLPYSRRMFTIIDRVGKKGGSWPVDKILDLYTEDEINNIYPVLCEGMIKGMMEEIELMDYGKVEDGNLVVTEKGVDRVKRYATEIPKEHAEALKIG